MGRSRADHDRGCGCSAETHARRGARLREGAGCLAPCCVDALPRWLAAAQAREHAAGEAQSCASSDEAEARRAARVAGAGRCAKLQWHVREKRATLPRHCAGRTSIHHERKGWAASGTTTTTAALQIWASV
ncbi:hypothetical protein ZEAMMB73_Zm00001d034873 [Zea mays]|jgi:hypothetical protein|uniref:Uncharacterized protein n=1 Tax=Zea mays TaxID=4577 RepID=A0A1D6LC42_MAIZE|nr:hypothetical protein ZEAMMB73_Zm00001d034873 [Zea mays]